jgi:uncharacterized membrane protein HdeD (DUF308 family)
MSIAANAAHRVVEDMLPPGGDSNCTQHLDGVLAWHREVSVNARDRLGVRLGDGVVPLTDAVCGGCFVIPCELFVEGSPMSVTQHELRHVRRALGVRGFSMFVLGLGAVLWPEQLLVGALILVGVIATLSGIYELSSAAALRPRTVYWRVALADGVMSVLFGAMTMVVVRLSHFAALAVVTGWLIVYAGLAWHTATVVWERRVARTSLFALGGVNIVLAILAAYPEGTVFALLFFGAAYAAFFGAWQLAIALWLRHWLAFHTGLLPRARENALRRIRA